MKATLPAQTTSGRKTGRLFLWRTLFPLAILLPGAGALYYLSRYNYLMFHSLVEMTSAAVAITTFSIGWHTRRFNRNNAFALLSAAYLSVGLLDLFHTLSYKGFGVIPETEIDVPTQFWIAARSLQAAAYLASGWVLGQSRRIDALKWTSVFLVAGLLMGLAIWPLDLFPACLTETGLTPFKIGAEYLISAALATSAWLYWRKRTWLDKGLLNLMLASIALAILSELAFTLYQDVYGLANCLGHLLKVGSIVFVYRALVLGALRNPYQSLFRDLTLSHQALDRELAERRHVEQQLREANRELDTFVQTVAHDLRSHLTVFISGTELLRCQFREKAPDSLLSLLNGMEEKSWQMARLLEDLLQLARIGRIEQPPETVLPSAVVTQVIADLQEQISDSVVRVEAETLPELQAHPTLVYQLFANLVGNAVRYAGDPEKPIIVGGRCAENKVLFFVRDHGPGIPAEDKERLGDLFFRGKNAGDHAGTGIGLAIVQKIASYYQGRFWVEDTPGGGATFWVELQKQEAKT
jgi:signal transduction histidine kinase